MNLRNLLKGVKVSLKDNSSAYGYSISITGAYAVLTTTTKTSTLGQLFVGAAGAAGAFLLIELIILALFRGQLAGDIPEQSRILARLMNVASVGGSMGAAALCGIYLHGMPAWAAGGFCATLTFLLVDSLQLTIVDGQKKGR